MMHLTAQTGVNNSALCLQVWLPDHDLLHLLGMAQCVCVYSFR
jgi:hypothetical protein